MLWHTVFRFGPLADVSHNVSFQMKQTTNITYAAPYQTDVVDDSDANNRVNYHYSNNLHRGIWWTLHRNR